MTAPRKLRMGMVGGGRGAFIGEVHRMASRLDGQIELVAGAFSSDPERARQSGEDLFVDPGRVYTSYEEMAAKEAALPEGQRIDFVSIVTPNHLHYPVARCFLQHGFHVVCDKPVTHRMEDAVALRDLVRQSGRLFALTHNYTGYPMVREARERVSRGELGELVKVVVEYTQGWLLGNVEAEGNKQAAWRTDPKLAGAAGCLGDIGTHAENLVHYVTGQKIAQVSADFTTLVPGRQLEDDAQLFLRYENGMKGLLFASQVSAGEENALRLRVYGTKASLEWRQEDPNELILKFPDQPRQILKTGNGYLSPHAQAGSRIPPGHPEAFLEAFANLYREFARAVRDRQADRDDGPYDFPTVEDGLEGLRFIATAVESAAHDSRWTKMVEV
ncbi:MAG: Gfo/Idh/MocA family oxidoreductase [Verrucomicrobiota bacterium JB022]|nr:Gfo/Idh/MocA family oxidoreductase [Verrucomicrobiota bacterium JB022]